MLMVPVKRPAPSNAFGEAPRTMGDSISYSRRGVLGRIGVIGGGAVLGSALAESAHIAAPIVVAANSHSDMSGMDMETTPPLNEDDMSSDEMDELHEARVNAFPAATKGLGGQPLAPVKDGDVKVFNITCEVIQWEYLPGKTVEAYAYNGTVPGPEMRVTKGDKVRIVVANQMPFSTAVHWHGVMLPNAMDGVPFITQPLIKPGATFVYEFTAREGNAGSHMYHSHANSAEQVTKGLLGPFIIEPKDPTTRPAFDLEHTIVLNDGPIGGFSLNGKSFPATQPIVCKKGQKILIRYMNEGLMIHPMHLHGMPQRVIARDGYLLPQPFLCDTLEISPGQRTEVIVEANDVGIWAFHCHILSHAEGPTGMFGMVTALIVQE